MPSRPWPLPRAASGDSWLCGSSRQLHFHRRALFALGLEEFGGAEAEAARHQQVGHPLHRVVVVAHGAVVEAACVLQVLLDLDQVALQLREVLAGLRSEEHTSELQSLMRISYAVFCLKKTKNNTQTK